MFYILERLRTNCWYYNNKVFSNGAFSDLDRDNAIDIGSSICDKCGRFLQYRQSRVLWD